MSTPLWPRSLALVGALALGLLGSGLGSGGCVLADYCIVTASAGKDWCASMSGALMWPEGQADLAEPVEPDNETLPRGCVCMNSGEQEILLGQTPADHYATLVAEIEDTTRTDCENLVPSGWAHNCLEVEDIIVDGVLIPAPNFAPLEIGESNPECIGTCSYAPDPPFGEPCGDPDPWECNGEDPPGTGDTGGDGGETGGTTGVIPIDDGRLAQ